MFICRTCHKADEAKYGCTYDGHFSHSYGSCEVCNKTTETADCKSHHYAPKTPAKPV